MMTNDSPVLVKITTLLKEKGKRQKALCEYLGLNQQAYTNWKNGSNDSYLKYLPEIADYFGVTTDYLLGRTSAPIPADFAELIADFSPKEMSDLCAFAEKIVSQREKNAE